MDKYNINKVLAERFNIHNTLPRSAWFSEENNHFRINCDYTTWGDLVTKIHEKTFSLNQYISADNSNLENFSKSDELVDIKVSSLNELDQSKVLKSPESVQLSDDEGGDDFMYMLDVYNLSNFDKICYTARVLIDWFWESLTDLIPDSFSDESN